jgi:hypothetical protein
MRLSAPHEHNEAIAIEEYRMQIFADLTLQESLEAQAIRFHVACTFHYQYARRFHDPQENSRRIPSIIRNYWRILETFVELRQLLEIAAYVLLQSPMFSDCLQSWTLLAAAGRAFRRSKTARGLAVR